MWCPARIETMDGRYRAVLLASPAVHADGDTRAAALAALEAEVARRFAGEVYWINVPPPAATADPPEYSDEVAAATEEMIAEIYRERDAQKAAEFPE